MLRSLRLPAIAAVYEDLALKVAKANLTHEEFLYELLRAECLQRDEHRVARLLRLSGLPPDKTFRTLQLDWRFPPPDLKVPLLLAGDLIYEMRNVEPIVSLIKQMLLPDGTCLLPRPDGTC